jgi:hypothetical protein
MNKRYKLDDLTEKEVGELQSCKDIKFVLTVPNPIHNSHVTDDYGNEIQPTRYNYDCVVEILPSTEERENKVDTYLSSLTLSGKDHGVDRFSREYSNLKKELGINAKRKMPQTIGESLKEFEEKYTMNDKQTTHIT